MSGGRVTDMQDRASVASSAAAARYQLTRANSR